MKTWRKLALVGFFASVSAAGCVVGSGDGDDDGQTVGGAGGTTAGTGGKGGGTGGTTAGTGGSGGSTGGSSGSGGSTGGSSGTGGSAAIQCDPNGTLGGTDGTCVPDDNTDACQVCIQQQCCAAWSNCTATSPDNPCYFGGPAGSAQGEIGCFQTCVINTQLDGGVANADTISACAGGCVTPGCGTIADTTNTVIDCLNTNCFADCLQVQ